MVKILLFATLREKYGRKEVEIDYNGDFKNLIDKVAEKLGKDFYIDIFDERGDLREDRIIMINGRNIKDLNDAEDKRISNIDKIAIFPPLAGG